MATALAREHREKVFITVTLSPTSALFSEPDGLLIHPRLARLGRVGELQDVQVLTAPRAEWPDVEDPVLDTLRGLPGVLRVDVQELPKLRAKRDEF